MMQILALWGYIMSLTFIVLAAMFAPQIHQKPDQFELVITISMMINVTTFVYAFCHKRKNHD